MLRRRNWRLKYVNVQNKTLSYALPPDPPPTQKFRFPHHRAGLGLPLGACQIDEVQLPHPDVVLAFVVHRAALDGDDEDGVRPRAVEVHVGRPGGIVRGNEWRKYLSLFTYSCL